MNIPIISASPKLHLPYLAKICFIGEGEPCEKFGDCQNILVSVRNILVDGELMGFTRLSSEECAVRYMVNFKKLALMWLRIKCAHLG